ncbi:MAG: hypothetical protein HQ551_00470 [Desulfobacteraceae bacterium]|nr:hypothetical protein [Desulfobacteraceae bacterium]
MTQRNVPFRRSYKSDVISCLVSMVDEMSGGQVKEEELYFLNGGKWVVVLY